VIPLLIGAVALFLAGLLQACTGFGLALMAAPCLLLMFEPTLVTPTLVSLSTVSTFLIAVHGRRHIRRDLVVLLAIGGVSGFPFGVWTLKSMDPSLLKVGVGAFVTLFALALYAGWSRPLRHPRRAYVPVGLAGGFRGGATSMGGPPVILFLANQQMPKDIFRSSIACYFLTVNCFGLAMYGVSGLLTWDVARSVVVLLPSMLIGTYVGTHVSARLDEAQFRRFAALAIVFMGVVLFVTNLRAVF